MGKRLRSGGGRSGMDRSILLRHIKSLNLNSSPDPDLVIQRLRDHYPDYARIKLQPFSVRLREVLQHLRNSSAKPTTAGETSQSQSSFSDGEGPSRKKCCKVDVFEERLLRAESEHLRQLQGNYAASSSQTKSSDDSTSTSDDAAFEESIGPEFDVTKSMLREKYVKQSEQNVKKGNVENNVEIETVANERRKSGIMMKKGAFSGKDIPVVRLGALDRHHGRTVVSEKALDCHLGGMKMVLDDLVTEVLVPLYHPELPRKLGVRPIAGILLHGPPGCGKTTLAHAIANAAHLPFYKISATEVVSGISGASEENIRDLFNKAHRTAPSIIFIDEIDAIASKRENLQREMERRIVTQLMTCMDRSQQILRAIDSDSVPEASDKTSDSSGYVLVIGATNRPDAIDQALRRPGRFDKEIALGVPDENARAEILSVLAHKREIKDKFDPFMIAKCTPGFVGADLEALLDKAGTLAMKRIVDKRRSQLSREQQENIEWLFHPWPLEEIKGLSRTMDDFEEAIKLVQPSTRREGFSPIPDIKWEDVGGLNSLRSVFNLNIIQSIKHPEVDKELGLNPEAGVLLYGPPGCGKTLIAMAVANDASANFIHIRGPEILDKYVGESEKKVREIFSRARTCSPCIIFFDEIDALTVDRRREGESVVGRVLLQLLSELDGGAQRHGVYVIAATNRPEVIDPAFLRTGRLGIHCYVPLPSADERVLILKALTSKMPVSPDLDYNAIAYAEACSNFSGADLAGLVKKAAMFVKEQMLMDQGILYNKSLVIKTSDFEKALEKIVPSVSKERRLHYETLSKNFGAS